MSNPSENPPPNPSSQDDEGQKVEAVSPSTDKSEIEGCSLKACDHHPLLEPSPSESVSSELTSSGGVDTETEIGETETDSIPSSKKSNVSSGPSVTSSSKGVDSSPNIKQLNRMAEDEISNVSDHPIEIEMDSELNEPVAGPSGIQQPVASSSLSVPVRACTVASTISSAASRSTYSSRHRRHTNPTPAPPQPTAVDIIFTLSKYLSYTLTIIQTSTVLTAVFDPSIFAFPSNTTIMYLILSLLSFFSLLFGFFVEELGFIGIAFFAYIALVVIYATEFKVIVSYWGLILISCIISLGVYLCMHAYHPRDLTTEYRIYLRALSSREITSAVNTDTEQACDDRVFPGVDLGLNRQENERTDSRNTLRPGSRGFSPTDSSRAASRAQSRGSRRAFDPIYEREDDSMAILVDNPTAETAL